MEKVEEEIEQKTDLDLDIKLLAIDVLENTQASALCRLKVKDGKIDLVFSLDNFKESNVIFHDADERSENEMANHVEVWVHKSHPLTNKELQQGLNVVLKKQSNADLSQKMITHWLYSFFHFRYRCPVMSLDTKKVFKELKLSEVDEQSYAQFIIEKFIDDEKKKKWFDEKKIKLSKGKCSCFLMLYFYCLVIYPKMEINFVFN